MGVRIDKAQWAYSGFMLFRERLARSEGINLREMAGFTTDGKPWEETSTDLRPLLDHSDCDGYLSPAECARVAPRLTAILDQWEQYADVDYGVEYDIEQGRALVESMRSHARRGERLAFT